MKDVTNVIKSILIVVFIVATIAGVIASIYAIWLTIFGVGWSGGDKSLLSIVWSWKGLWILTLYSIIASYGLIKNLKNGTIFSFAITICILVYFIYDYWLLFRYWNSAKSTMFLSTTLYFGLAILTIIGLYKIRKSQFEFSRKDYLKVVFLAMIVILSFYFMFD